MNRFIAIVVVLVGAAYGIRAGLEYFEAQEEKRRAEDRARLIVEAMTPDGDVTVGLCMWHAGRRSFSGPLSVMETVDLVYRRWLREKGIGEVGSVEVIGSQKLADSEHPGKSAWAVGLAVDGREVWMQLVPDEPAEWIESPS